MCMSQQSIHVSRVLRSVGSTLYAMTNSYVAAVRSGRAVWLAAVRMCGLAARANRDLDRALPGNSLHV